MSSPVIAFVAVAALWMGAGVYGRRLGIRFRSPASLGAVSTVLRGPLTLHMALVMTTKPLQPTLALMPSDLYADAEAPMVATESMRPDKLPGRPLTGSTKTVCPTCSEAAGRAVKTKHSRSALCASCRQINQWLAEKWGVAGTPLSVAEQQAGVLEADVISTTAPASAPVTFAVDPPVVAAPLAPNAVIVEDAEVEDAAVITEDAPDESPEPPEAVAFPEDAPAVVENPLPEATPITEVHAHVPEVIEEQVATDSELCANCHRTRFADLHGNCVFCESPLTGDDSA